MQLYLSRKRMFGLLGFAVGKVMRLGRPEEALVRESQRGDRPAFDQLLKLYAPQIKRFVASKVSASDREDIIQDTWVAAWEGIRNFNADSDFRLWLFAICFHKIQDHWRRQRGRGALLDVDTQEAATLYYPSDFGKIELKLCLESFLAACTPEQIEFLQMYYAYGFTLKEIAEVHHRNLNTVKYQFYRIHELAARHLPADPETLLSKAVVA